MYVFKKLVGAFLSPLTFALALAIVGAILRLRAQHRAATRWFLCSGIFAWLIATPLVGGLLIAPLERQYAPLPDFPKVRFVVVLGSSYLPHVNLPVTTAVDDAGMRRLVEGLRILRLVPGSQLLVSGGSPHPGTEPAVGNALLATSLGLVRDRITLLSQPLDTRGEAAAVVAHTGSASFILVTSAAHMPRAMEYMRRAGGHPIAAPTGQRAPRSLHIASLLPGSAGLRLSEDAIHEYLGWLALMADLN